VSPDTSELTGSAGGPVPTARPGGSGTSTEPAASRQPGSGGPAARTAPVRPAGLAGTPAPPVVRAPGRGRVGPGKGWLSWVPEPITRYRPASEADLAAVERGAGAATRPVRRRGTVASTLRMIFRLPKMEDPNPGGRHLALVCGWGVALGVMGLLTAIRAFIAIYTVAPAWYAPAVSVAGLAGTALTITALFAVQWRQLARLLLMLATAALIVVIVLTGLVV
jgi:hypothetical protein